MTVYQGMLLMLDIVDTYIIYKYISLFYGKTGSSRKAELFSYVIFYMISAGVLFLNHIPMLNLLYTIAAYYLLGLNYNAGILKRIFNTVSVTAIMICLEGAASALFGIFQLNQVMEYPNKEIQTKLIFLVLEYGAYLLISCLSNLKHSEISIRHWLELIVIPLLSLMYIIQLSFHADGETAMFGSIVVFIINLVTFYLYSSLQEMISVKREKEMLARQMEIYSRQYEQMKDTISNTRRLRHDLKNLFIQIEALADGKHRRELSELIGTAEEKLNGQYLYANSGNIVFDSILNYKLQEAVSKGIAVDLNVRIPQDKEFSAFDMAALLGNLIDNAIEAAEQLTNNQKYIRMELTYDRSVLHLYIENSYISPGNPDLSTVKKDSENHGIGLLSVRSIVDKYNGELRITREANIFKTEIQLLVS